MAEKICPVPMMRQRICSDSCVFYGPFTNPKTGETFLSCAKMHTRIYPSNVAPAVDTCESARRV